MLVYTTDERGGMLSHETGRIHWLGSLVDSIDWIYGELLAKRTPEYDYNAWR
jgi:hypothetical protein